MSDQSRTVESFKEIAVKRTESSLMYCKEKNYVGGCKGKKESVWFLEDRHVYGT